MDAESSGELLLSRFGGTTVANFEGLFNLDFSYYIYFSVLFSWIVLLETSIVFKVFFKSLSSEKTRIVSKLFCY